VLSQPKELGDNNKLYLRKAGAMIRGQYPYLTTDATGHYTAVVFATTRDVAKSRVWVTFGSKARFFR
jgi:hypothetical protein